MFRQGVQRSPDAGVQLAQIVLVHLFGAFELVAGDGEELAGDGWRLRAWHTPGMRTWHMRPAASLRRFVAGLSCDGRGRILGGKPSCDPHSADVFFGFEVVSIGAPRLSVAFLKTTPGRGVEYLVDDRDGRVAHVGDAAAQTRQILEIIEQGSSAQALAAIQEHRPDVVLLDVHLPGGGGVEVMRRLAATAGEVPRFLALSVSDAAEDVIGTIRAGARGYVTKTISGPELADAIRATPVRFVWKRKLRISRRRSPSTDIGAFPCRRSSMPSARQCWMHCARRRN